MRLIDADAMLETLKRKYPRWYTGKPKDSWMHYVWLVYQWAVEHAPTIEAIPISFLEKLRDNAHNDEAALMIDEIIAQWRENHE